MKFACVDGADFDGHLVNFDELQLRQKRFAREEKAAMERFRSESAKLAGFPESQRGNPRTPRAGVQAAGSDSRNARPAHSQEHQDDSAGARAHAAPAGRKRAYTISTRFRSAWIWMARFHEAERCLRCKKPRCVPGCPVGIDIPGFISALARKDVEQSYRILKSSNALPAVCGRVCPQESQCEATCVVGLKFKPVAIGRLERFVADAAHGPRVGSRRRRRRSRRPSARPSSAAVRRDWLAPENWRGTGCQVTIFEALHVAGGVLKYGIPEFRLPDIIIDAEIENLKKMGVEIQLDTIIGKLFTIPQLLGEMGYQTAFVGTGAGSPKFASIPGEAYNGVFSANEFLTRVNLMRGHRQPHLRHSGRHGKARGGGRRGQYGDGFGARSHAHGRRIGDRGLSPLAARIAGPRRRNWSTPSKRASSSSGSHSRWRSWAVRTVGSPACAARRWNWASRMPRAAAGRWRWRARIS